MARRPHLGARQVETLLDAFSEDFPDEYKASVDCFCPIFAWEMSFRHRKSGASSFVSVSVGLAIGDGAHRMS